MVRSILKPLIAVLLMSAALTCALSRPAKAFTPFKTSSNTPYSWNLATLQNTTILWQADANVPAMASESMNAMLQSWADATGGAFKAAQGPGGIVVEWDTDGSKIPDPLYLAFTTFNSDNAGHILGARIIVNALNYTWHRGGYGGVAPAVNGVRDANIDSVLLHELGHALGLDHSDKNPAAIVGVQLAGDPPTMNSVIYPNAGTLHDDDRAGIHSLYAAAATAPSAITLSPSVLSGKAPLTVDFTQFGGDASTTWNFGDGSTGSGMTANHVFTANGAYTVKVDCLGTVSTTTILVGTKAIHAAAAAKAKAAHGTKQKSNLTK